MSRDPRLLLEDILLACDRIMAYTQGMDREAFGNDPRTVDAVLRNLTVIGEAVKRLPMAFRESHPQIAWRKIAGFRDVVVHDYFGVDIELVWDVVRSQVPHLKAQVEKILRQE
ncbi:DUF86 domain-containing protein [Thermus sp.]|uniref:HepT-like ribonuclease domain-containing protein n=1 Tax=Thermus sp. TaxID=275 RepID=UPI0028CC63B7|nr:DUF86 domain-containing protein [Thermus sp.]MDT7909870.1 DUF86 domain-containing protein [Thermus sp.]